MRGLTFLLSLAFALPSLVPAQMEEGIPVTDRLVLEKCGSCHAADERGNMRSISWERASPEGWEEALKRMIRASRVTLTPPEARSIVKYLSATHGLAPDEMRPVMYYAERRVHDETGMVNQNLMDACSKCHAIARPLSWRRSFDEWKQFIAAHATRYKLKTNDEATSFLSKTAPLHTPEWDAWSARSDKAELTGRWLVTAHLQGHGTFCGEMDVQPGSANGEFVTRVSLKAINDGSAIVRTGRNVVYGGYGWRGRSKGMEMNSTPGDPTSEAREVMWVSPDGSQAEGRWFWGQYQEFGFDVTMRRPSAGPDLLAINLKSLKTGSHGNRIRLIGDRFPAKVTPADVTAGPGVSVRRIVSSAPGELVAEMDVASDAPLGMRDVSLRSSTLKGAVAVYDRVDYVKVTPESSMAAFGSPMYPRGYQQFEAIGFQRGPDGKMHTADDIDLGPIDATWSMEVFYETDASKRYLVGDVSTSGLFTPATESPNTNYDIWVIATAKDARNKEGGPLLGKGYVVVTVPTYTFEGRRYVRELDRWVEDGSETR